MVCEELTAERFQPVLFPKVRNLVYMYTYIKERVSSIQPNSANLVVEKAVSLYPEFPCRPVPSCVVMSCAICLCVMSWQTKKRKKCSHTPKKRLDMKTCRQQQRLFHWGLNDIATQNMKANRMQTTSFSCWSLRSNFLCPQSYPWPQWRQAIEMIQLPSVVQAALRCGWETSCSCSPSVWAPDSGIRQNVTGKQSVNCQGTSYIAFKPWPHRNRVRVRDCFCISQNRPRRVRDASIHRPRCGHNNRINKVLGVARCSVESPSEFLVFFWFFLSQTNIFGYQDDKQLHWSLDNCCFAQGNPTVFYPKDPPWSIFTETCLDFLVS